ncbi:uncharacterized protein LOC128040456 [Gossypium raimondii]|uniref:uncharacterized protein LOC128040456 n=1 Tax=Gossypium raimondii TaxID=29730 RepID=UPI00227A4CFC|nr:uncharacterized protein LOC128040456 [Gossypium raimondii]
MAKNDATLRNLKNQVGQLATELRNRPQGALPSDIENPRNLGKEHCKALTLRSGKKVEPNIVEVEKEPTTPRFRRSSTKIASKDESTRITPSNETTTTLPSKTCKCTEIQFKKFLDILKQLHINIPLVKALKQIPNYVKFMKDILSKKRRLREFETLRESIEGIHGGNDATLRNLKNQVGQLATELRNRPQGALPSDIENPRNLGKEHCKALTLRSGKKVEPNIVEVEKEPTDAQDLEEVQPSVEIPVSPEPESAKPDKVTSGPANSDQLTMSFDAELPPKTNQLESVPVMKPPPPYPQRLEMSGDSIQEVP